MANTPYVTTDTLRHSVSPNPVVGGTAETVGFYGGTGSTQRASAVQVAFADTLTSTTPFGFSDKAHGDSLIAKVNEIIATLTALNLWKGGA